MFGMRSIAAVDVDPELGVPYRNAAGCVVDEEFLVRAAVYRSTLKEWSAAHGPLPGSLLSSFAHAAAFSDARARAAEVPPGASIEFPDGRKAERTTEPNERLMLFAKADGDPLYEMRAIPTGSRVLWDDPRHAFVVFPDGTVMHIDPQMHLVLQTDESWRRKR
jgi:hypothetical protein